MKTFTRTLSALLLSLLLSKISYAIDETLWQALHDGGNVLLMRHATTEKSKDPLLFEPDNCISERDLSIEGKALVLDMGHALRKHAVPIGTVLSSRFCRAINTAWMTYDKVELWAPLDLIQGLPEDDANAQMDIVAERIGSYKGEKNLVMVTHRPNINHLTLELPPYAGIVVVKPAGDGEFDVIGILSPKELLDKPVNNN